MDSYQIIKYLKNSCTDSEKSVIKEWIASAPENEKQFNKIKKIWEESQFVTETLHFDNTGAWEYIQNNLDINKPNRPAITFVFSPLFLKIAASLLLFIALGTLYLLLNNTSTITVNNTSNSKKDIRLPDRTIVSLNRNATITYPKVFKDKVREVKMNGEVYFNVTRDVNHPFIVSANGTIVRVLGTSFNIKISGSDSVVVSVLSGKVAFHPSNNPHNYVHLNKGEIGRFNYHDAQLKKRTIIDKNFLSWETGILQFNNQTLEAVAKVLSGYYNIKFEVEETIQNRKITTSFNNLSINEVIEILKVTLDIKIIQKPGIVQLFPLY